MELVTASEAARQLGVHPSQITRGIQSGLIKNHAPPGRSDRPLDQRPGAGSARREQSAAWTARSCAARGRPFAGIDQAAANEPRHLREVATGLTTAAGGRGSFRRSTPLPDGGSADDDERDPSYQVSRARRENAAAAKAEDRTPRPASRARRPDRAEVVDVAFRLGQMLREGMETRRVALAQRLVGLDLPAMIAVLTDADDMHLGALADAIARDLAPEETRIAA